MAANDIGGRVFYTGNGINRSIPPRRCSYTAVVCDLAMFGPVERVWSGKLRKLQRKDGQNLEKNVVAHLLKRRKHSELGKWLFVDFLKPESLKISIGP